VAEHDHAHSLRGKVAKHDHAQGLRVKAAKHDHAHGLRDKVAKHDDGHGPLAVKWPNIISHVGLTVCTDIWYRGTDSFLMPRVLNMPKHTLSCPES
jgi:hypothetical protein